MSDASITARQPLPARDPLLARPAKPIPERAQDLAQLEAQVEAIRREAALLTAALRAEQLQRLPHPPPPGVSRCQPALLPAPTSVPP